MIHGSTSIRDTHDVVRKKDQSTCNKVDGL